MPVPTLISQLSTTASLNSPDGAVDVPSSIDDYLRAHAAFIAQLYASTAQSVDIQNQTVTAFTTGGTSTAFTGAPNPPITSNTAGQRFMATLHAAPSGSPTLAVSGLSALGFKYYDPAGVKQFVTASQAPSNYPCDVVSDGTDWVLLNPIDAIASTAEAQAWAANDKFLTPQRIAEAFMGLNRSLTSNGYFRIPGVSGGLKDGHIVQYGYFVNTGATDTITFPITFPNNIFTVLPTPANTVNQLAMTVRSAQTTSNFTVKPYIAAPGAALVAATAGQVGISWIAIGN